MYGNSNMGRSISIYGRNAGMPPRQLHPSAVGYQDAVYLQHYGVVSLAEAEAFDLRDLAQAVVVSKYQTTGVFHAGDRWPSQEEYQVEVDKLVDTWMLAVKAQAAKLRAVQAKVEAVREEGPRVSGPIVGLRQWVTHPWSPALDVALGSTGMGGSHWHKRDKDGWVRASCPVVLKDASKDRFPSFSGMVWPRPKMTHALVVPDQFCGCGLHGYFLDACLDDPTSTGILAPQWARTAVQERVAGVIQAKGVTVVHVDGFRAEMARIVAFLDMTVQPSPYVNMGGHDLERYRQVLRQLGDQFGVPVLPYKPALLRKQLPEFGEIAPSFHDLPDFVGP